MRRLGKRIVAITLAATMMGSLTPQAMTFLQNEVVYAAETSGAVYESTDSKEVKDVDFSDLEDVSWDRKENVEYANTNDEVRKINENYKIKVKIGIDAAGYKSIENSGYIKLKGYVKDAAWVYVGSDTYPDFTADKFERGDDGKYYTDAVVSFNDKTPTQLNQVGFEILGAKFQGKVSLSNVTVIDIITEKPELVKKEPTVLSNLNDKSQVEQWTGEDGYKYNHGGNEAAKPVLAYDANGEDGRLKVSLDYFCSRR